MKSSSVKNGLLIAFALVAIGWAGWRVFGRQAQPVDLALGLSVLKTLAFAGLLVGSMTAFGSKGPAGDRAVAWLWGVVLLVLAMIVLLVF